MNKVIVIYNHAEYIRIYWGIADDKYYEQLLLCHRTYDNEHGVSQSIRKTIVSIPYLLKQVPAHDTPILDGTIIITGYLP